MAFTIGQPNFAPCLAVSWPGTLYTFLGPLPPNGILPGAKFTLHPSLAISYWQRYTVRHSSRERQPNFAASYKEWNYGTFADGATYIPLGSHHIGHRDKILVFLLQLRHWSNAHHQFSCFSACVQHQNSPSATSSIQQSIQNCLTQSLTLKQQEG